MTFQPTPETLAALRHMANMDPEHLQAIVTAAAVEILGYVKPYPPAPSDSSYIRGGPLSENLGSSWTVQPIAEDAVAIGTNVSYARWVKDEERQTDVMQTIGWRTIQDDVAAATPTVLAHVEQLVRRWLTT